ncbi:MAG: molybdenum cofactor guanylyltransferase [bacterium]
MKAKYTDAGGAILAGGKGLRLNDTNKAFININGEPVIRRTLNTLKQLFNEIIIVTNSPGDFKAYGKECVIVQDIIKDKGPLSGIHSALTHASGERVFVTACDMPFISADFVKRLTDEASSGDYDCVIPSGKKGIEPLHGVYSRRILKLVSSLLRGSEYSVRRLIESCRHKYVEADEREIKSFYNINALEDMEKLAHNAD